jgi:hypothetical protein
LPIDGSQIAISIDHLRRFYLLKNLHRYQSVKTVWQARFNAKPSYPLHAFLNSGMYFSKQKESLLHCSQPSKNHSTII